MLKLLTLGLLIVTSYGKNPEDHYLNGLNFYPREERQFAVVKPLKPLYLSDAADSDFGIADDYYDYLFNNIPANSKNAGSMDEMRVWIAKRNGAHRILPNCSCPNKTTIISQDDTHFPRFLKNVGCEDSHIHSKNCVRGSKCSEIIYNANVLVKKSEEDLRENSNMIPRKLRKGWKLKIIPISVECHCLQS